MNQSNPVLLTLQQIEQKLGQRFTFEQTAALAEVFDSFRQMEIRHAKDTTELKQAMARLTVAVEKLTEAQARTEARLDTLEAAMARLAEAQARTEARLDTLEAAMARLAEAQARTEARLDTLEAAMARLAEAQARTEARLDKVEQRLDNVEQRLGALETAMTSLAAAVEKLTEAQARTEARLDTLEAAMVRLDAAVEKLTLAQARTEPWLDNTDKILAQHQRRMDKIIGLQLEQDYARKAYGYFGRVLRRIRVVSWQEIEENLVRSLSADELADLLLLDLLIRGQPYQQPNAPEVWLAIEVSAKLDKQDAERAQRRAALLQKAGYCAIPTLAGEKITQGALALAAEQQLFVLQNGHHDFWDKALEAALPH
jgi:DNA repair ATPase RecN